ncbi:uncharacterized protein PFLUO_LOCUS2908 [Penicillium psychrofluorescens]|uniref:uncharacterized protein n=1 Tax=Penicillium psychrofluorescens TaxID=3158075 RepID=UPI003CCDF96A
MKEENPPVTSPDDSVLGDENSQTASKTVNPSAKDRKCQYCAQAFTSSSLGRHLDQFLFKKKPDGIHDVEEIRRIRSGITRRQARTSSGRHDSPDHSMKKGSSDPNATGESGSRARDTPVRMMFNTPTWHATGVINDIPNPSQGPEGPRLAPSQSRTGSMQLPDYASRGASAKDPDTMRALELALREVLDNIKAATSRIRPRSSPFDFDIQAQTFPSLCLHLLPPPPSLFASHPFSSPTSFPLEQPGAEHLEIVRQALRSQISQWLNDQLAGDAASAPHARTVNNSGTEANILYRNAQQHEEMSFRQLDLAFNHWTSLSHDTRRDAWQLELTRAFARESEKRKSLDEQLARVQQEANQLRAQVERLGSCQWPREFALFPPDTLPLPRDLTRELEVQESQTSADGVRWDYDNVVAKWKRVVMHDKSMGRIGVGYANTAYETDPNINNTTTAQQSSYRHNTSHQTPDVRPPRPGEDTSSHPNRLRPIQSSAAATMSPDPATASTPTSSTHYASPYSHTDPRSPPAGSAGGGPPHAKRPRLMNGNDGPQAPESSVEGGGGLPAPSTTMDRPPGLWGSSTPLLSNIAAPSPTPPSRP